MTFLVPSTPRPVFVKMFFYTVRRDALSSHFNFETLAALQIVSFPGTVCSSSQPTKTFFHILEFRTSGALKSSIKCGLSGNPAVKVSVHHDRKALS